jgi:DNA-binding CsgD family transcriptional regulator
MKTSCEVETENDFGERCSDNASFTERPEDATQNEANSEDSLGRRGYYKLTPETINIGKKWLPEEEQKLLDYISNGMNIETIAIEHKRSEGGIKSKLREIAYKLHCSNTPMEEIIQKTRLSQTEIQETVSKKNALESKSAFGKKTNTKTSSMTPLSSSIMVDELNQNSEPTNIVIAEVFKEVKTMKNEINDLKKNIKTLIELIQAIYEFSE